MESLNLAGQHTYQLFSFIGISHPLLAIDTELILHTWIIIGLLATLLCVMQVAIMYDRGIVRYAIVHGAQMFITLCNDSLETFNFAHVAFVASIFSFIAACNVFPIIPWLEEPTRNINTTLALGIVSFLYVEKTAIKTHGFIAYILSYFDSPIPSTIGKIIGAVFFFPLNVIGKLASIVSISFRLFGNIFGGSIITTLYFSAIARAWYLEMFGIVSGFNLLIVGFFTLFEGLLQAFVFTMLTLTYLAMAAQKESL